MRRLDGPSPESSQSARNVRYEVAVSTEYLVYSSDDWEQEHTKQGTERESISLKVAKYDKEKDKQLH